MHIPPCPHSWRLSAKQAIAVQRDLAARVRTATLSTAPKYLAGVDCAFTKDKQYCIAAVVLWHLPTHSVIEQHTAHRKLHMPYIPGLLSFREAPAMLAALTKLRQQPDVILVDGHGIAHPRRLGIASHLGVITHIPTAGCAKSRLIGDAREPAETRGASTRLSHKGETIGSLVRTRANVKPVYVSVGHLIDLPSARSLCLQAAIGYRLPEPTRLADKLVSASKQHPLALKS